MQSGATGFNFRKYTMKKVFAVSAVLASGFAVGHVSAQDILARVVSSTPVVQQIAVPRQICNNQQVVTAAPKSGGGALLGAVAGGAVGNAIGNGNGRAAATAIGLIGGAILGDRVEGGGSQVQNVQQCNTQTFYENRTSYYNVVYDYQGTQYNTQMTQDPGPYVRLQITPVGAVTPNVQPGFQPVPQQQLQVQSQVQPQTFFEQAPMQYAEQPGYVIQQSVIQQPVFVAPVVVQSPSYYGQPYYARPYYPRPYYAPSIQFNYSRGYGYGHGQRRWR